MKRNLLFVAATPFEAKAVLSQIFPTEKIRFSKHSSALYLLWKHASLPIRCVVTGMGLSAAEVALETALESEVGVQSVVGFGVAGGLLKTAVEGTVIFPTRVLRDREEEIPTEWLRMSLASHISVQPLRTLLTEKQLVCSTIEKVSLYAATSAEAVDMESAAWGKVCRTKGIPWVVLRTILDRADEEVPESFRMLCGTFGEPKWKQTILRFLLHPSELRVALRIQKRMASKVTLPIATILSSWLAAEG